MTEIDEGRLADFALGLGDNPELKRALEGSAELRARFRDVTSEMGRLDREFGQMVAQQRRSTRKLSGGPWSILLAFDDSESARRATSSAAALAQASDGEVVVLHVREMVSVKMGPPCLESSAEAARMVDNVVTALRDLGVSARGMTSAVAVGRVAGAILVAAESLRADLIVMGSRGFSGFAGAFFDSVSHKTLQKAPCPVLVVR
jgi:nucleotide-binding universal stress UspA family protein